MEPTLLFYAIGWTGVGILLITLVVGDILDFLSFDFLDGSLGPTAIFGFLSVFGLTGGMLLGNTDLNLWACVAIALLAGAVFGFIITRILDFFSKSNSGEVSESSIVGDTGFVVLTIPEKGYGKIKVNNSGHSMELAAMSPGQSIPSGSKVTIMSVLGTGSVLVEPVNIAEENNQ